MLNNKIVRNVTEALNEEFPNKLPPILLISDSEASYESVCIAIDSINKRKPDILIIKGTEGYDSRNKKITRDCGSKSSIKDSLPLAFFRCVRRYVSKE